MSVHGPARLTFFPVVAFVLYGFAANPIVETVGKIDLQDRVLTTTDGVAYALRPDFQSSDVQPGDKVLITWGMFHGKLALDHIVVCRTDEQCRQ